MAIKNMHPSGLQRAYYAAPVIKFLKEDPDTVLGKLAAGMTADLTPAQRGAWEEQIVLLQSALRDIGSGFILFEYAIPRVGKRIDTVVIVGNVIIVLEFKVGADRWDRSAIEQAVDYALDLRNFHEGSHSYAIVPIVVSTKANGSRLDIVGGEDDVFNAVLTGSTHLADAILRAACCGAGPNIDAEEWLKAGFRPTPTIVEASQVLYRGHSVDEISRSESGSDNLGSTTRVLMRVIHEARSQNLKALCVVTGVPGAGKTLAGLNLASASRRADFSDTEHAVFLSGNGPLVSVLQEALARDDVAQNKAKGETLRKTDAQRRAKAFIQNVHKFRDECLRTSQEPPEHVVVFDEAQRAWDCEKTSDFMRKKRGELDFNMSEPAFLIGAMDRHQDWAVIVCLIGDGQEINTGEAGAGEWLNALRLSFPHWVIYAPTIVQSNVMELTPESDDWFARKATRVPELHLSVSLRSFRSELLSEGIAALLAGEAERATELLADIRQRYPIVITRSLDAAKAWVRKRARGSERYGLLASSNAKRLRPIGVFVDAGVDPCHWFLNSADDVRSSYFLEYPASEFEVQGLELDWAIVCWDGDLARQKDSWAYRKFKGTRWQSIRNKRDQHYRLNAYRVLLTRARQGLAIVVPEGSPIDHTRPTSQYDPTWNYLRSLGLPEL